MFKKKSNITLYLVGAILVFAALARGGVQGWAMTVIHMMTLVALTSLLVQKSLDWSWSWIRTPLDIPIFVLLALAGLSTFLSVHRPTSVWAFFLLVNYVVIFYLVIHTVHTRNELRRLVWVIIGIGIFLAVFGMLKLGGIKAFSWFHYDDLPDFGALTSTYGNPNHIAGFFEMAIPLVLGLLLVERHRSQVLQKHLPLFLLFGSALLLSMSRGGWSCGMLGLVFFVSVLFLSVDFPRRRMVLSLTGSGIVLVLILLSSYPAVRELLTVSEVIDQAGGLDGRLQVTKAAMAMTGDRPLLGFGPGTFPFAFLKFQPPGISGWYNMAHNDYVHFIAETGFFLLIVMVWMVAALFRYGFAKIKKSGSLVQGITVGSMAGIFAILCHSFIDFNLHIPANALFFVVLAAFVASPIEGRRTEDRGLRSKD